MAYVNGADPLSGGSAAIASEKAAEYLAAQYNDGVSYNNEAGEFEPNRLPENVKQEIRAITGAIGTLVGGVSGSARHGNGNAVDVLTNAQVGGVVGQNIVENNELLGEIEFLIRHPKIAAEIGTASKNPERELDPNISTIASTFQLNLFNNRIFGGEGGVGNAFRHVLWQALITSRFGKDIAIQAGNSHETGFKIDFSNRRNIPLAKADEMIDQLNNSIGREIAINNPTANNKELAYMILDHFAKVGLYQAERSNSNLYNVVRKPISQSDYNNALIKLNSLDNTGAGPTIQRERTRRRDIMIRLINSYGRKF